MLIEGLINRGAIPVLEQVMAFTQARQEVLANNISNFDTVGYKVQDLSVPEFCQALSKAVERRDKQGAGQPLRMESTRSLRWDRRGRLQARPVEIEDGNILFHDDNNRFVEKQMSGMARNGLLHSVAVELLRAQYNGLQTALRGRL